MARHVAILFTMLALLGHATVAQAFVGAIWDYVKQYQVGIDYTTSSDDVHVNYRTKRQDPTSTEYPERCEAEGSDGTDQRCEVSMQGGASNGYGIFLQQAFRRQGFFYFKPDIGFGLRYLNGSLSKRDAEEAEAAGSPLRKMSFSLVAVVAKPYIQFGITPAETWPDFLVSIGPAAQVAVGTVKVNDESESAAMATSSGLLSGFFELELVFWRFGDGALSLFSSSDVTGNEEGTKFYPKSVDGMDDFKADFTRTVFGLKFLLDWP